VVTQIYWWVGVGFVACLSIVQEGTMKTRTLSSVALIVLLALTSGCAKKLYGNKKYPQASIQSYFNRDSRHCKADSYKYVSSPQINYSQPKSGDMLQSFVNGYNLGGISEANKARSMIYWDCMHQLGWYRMAPQTNSVAIKQKVQPNTIFTFKGKNYTTSQDALAAIKQSISEAALELTPVTTNPTGNAIVITSLQEKCTKYCVSDKQKKESTPDGVRYLGEYWKQTYAGFQKYLEVGNIFRSVAHEYHDSPRQRVVELSDQFDAIIYLDIQSKSDMSWQIIVPPWPMPVRINFGKDATTGTEKRQSWIANVSNEVSSAASINH